MTALHDDCVMTRGSSRPGVEEEEKEDRWHTAWSHREALLRVARRRSVSEADAEDAVAEAILRSQQTDGVDVQRLGAWLTSVTIRLCADQARDRGRDPKRIAYQRRQGLTASDHADDVCERAEAGWLASYVTGLPPRQQRALQLRADGMDVAAVAAAMNVTESTVHALLHRARKRLRGILASAASWIGLLIASLVTATRRSSATAVATATAFAATSAVLWGAADIRAGDPGKAAPPMGPQRAVTAPNNHATAVAPATAPAEASQVAPEVTVDADQRDRPAGTPPPARPVELPSVTPPTQEPSSVEVAGVGTRGGGTSYHESDETFIESTQRCLEQGPEVSTEFIGCRPR